MKFISIHGVANSFFFFQGITSLTLVMTEKSVGLLRRFAPRNDEGNRHCEPSQTAWQSLYFALGVFRRLRIA